MCILQEHNSEWGEHRPSIAEAPLLPAYLFVLSGTISSRSTPSPRRADRQRTIKADGSQSFETKKWMYCITVVIIVVKYIRCFEGTIHRQLHCQWILGYKIQNCMSGLLCEYKHRDRSFCWSTPLPLTFLPLILAFNVALYYILYFMSSIGDRISLSRTLATQST